MAVAVRLPQKPDYVAWLCENVEEDRLLPTSNAANVLHALDKLLDFLQSSLQHRVHDLIELLKAFK